jgi:hypothetical protein
MQPSHEPGVLSARLNPDIRPKKRAPCGGCQHDPCSSEIRDARGQPLIHPDRKGFLRRHFSHIEVAEERNQGREDPAPIGAINRVDSGVCSRERTQL